jgi:exonuclease III
MDFPGESVFNEMCPEDVSILCGKQTLGKGLCVKSAEECNIRTKEGRAILTFPEDAAGKNYAYENEFLGRSCYVKPEDLSVDWHKTYSTYDTVPESFSLMTYNIWGLSNRPNLVKLFGLRKKLLLKTLNNANADMFCFQEMSKESYEIMADWISGYAYASEVPYVGDASRNRNVDTYFVSRYRPKSMTIYGLDGVLKYKNALLVVEYPNLVVYNLYNQAGSRLSIGQDKTWIHYSRCRYDILNIIYDMMPKDKNVIVCGDFNFHLDGSANDWPEMDIINLYKKAGFVDSYRAIHRVGGFTENTDENLMRWNQKLVEKKYRYDAILYKPVARGWAIVDSRIVGKDLAWLGVQDSKWFYDEVSEARKKGTDGFSELKGVRRTKKGYRLPINASDHFGVLTKFKMVQRRWVTRKAGFKTN